MKAWYNHHGGSYEKSGKGEETKNKEENHDFVDFNIGIFFIGIRL